MSVDRELLTRRLRAVKENPEATALLLDSWPGGKISEASDTRLKLMDDTLSGVEQQYGLSFEPYETEFESTIADAEPAPDQLVMDEGGPADPAEINAIKAVLATIDQPNADFITEMAAYANTAGRYIGFVNHPTRRRVEIAKALIHLSSMSVLDAADVIAAVTEAPEDSTIGQMVGTLTIAQAQLLQMTDTTERGEQQ